MMTGETDTGKQEDRYIVEHWYYFKMSPEFAAGAWKSTRQGLIALETTSKYILQLVLSAAV